MSKVVKSLAAMAMLLLTPETASPETMSGDPRAVAMARGIAEAMGGREKWAAAEWVYAREDAWFAARPSPADAQFWRRVAAPAEKARITGPGWSSEHRWNEAGGYRTRDGVESKLGAEELAQLHGWWRGEIYMMYVRFAREDSRLRLEATGDASFRVREGDRDLGEFFVDQSGALYRWRWAYGLDSVDYLYDGHYPCRGDLRPVRDKVIRL